MADHALLVYECPDRYLIASISFNGSLYVSNSCAITEKKGRRKSWRVREKRGIGITLDFMSITTQQRMAKLNFCISIAHRAEDHFVEKFSECRKVAKLYKLSLEIYYTFEFTHMSANFIIFFGHYRKFSTQ